MMTSTFWTPSSYPNVKTERDQDYNAGLFEDEDACLAKKKSFRDPISHRIIEKRRRDRMNNCLADLSRLIPSKYLKKGRGRIEKTEIIEMAIKHLKQLRTGSCQDCESHKSTKNIEQFKAGYRGCMDEVLNFLVKVEGHRMEDSICVRLINHLHREIDNIFLASTCGKSSNSGGTRSVSSSAGSGSTGGYAANGSSSSYSSDGNGSSGKPEQYSLPGVSHCLARMGSDTTSSNSDVGSCGKEEGNAQDHATSGESVRYDMTSGYSTTSMPSLCEDQNYFPQYDQKELPEYGAQSKYPYSSGGGTDNPLQTHPAENMDCYEQDNNAGGYKFKTNMKKRFNASHFGVPPHNNEKLFPEESEIKPCQERECVYNEFRAHQSSTTPNYKPHYVPCRDELKDKRGDHGPRGRKPPFPVKPGVQISSMPRKPHSFTHEIPIFALHPKGAFYVPLIVDAALLLPKLNLISEAVPTLHPVTISVNFFGALRPYMIPLPAGEAQSLPTEPVLWSERVAHFITSQQSHPTITTPLTDNYFNTKMFKNDMSNRSLLNSSFSCHKGSCSDLRSTQMDSSFTKSSKSEDDRKLPEKDKLKRRRRMENPSREAPATVLTNSGTLSDVT